MFRSNPAWSQPGHRRSLWLGDIGSRDLHDAVPVDAADAGVLML
jgi:hypothetical protein